MSDTTTSGGAPAAAPAPTSTPAANGTPATAGPAANGAPATPSQASPAAPWKRTAKLFGKEVTLTDEEVPPEYRTRMGEEKAVAYALRGLAGDQALREASEARRQAESTRSKIKNPSTAMAALLEEYGGDQRAVDTFIEAYYSQRQREAEMDPTARELAQTRAQLEQAKAREDARLKGEKAERERTAIAARRDDYAKRFVPALAAAKLPQTPRLVERMATHLVIALQAMGGRATQKTIEASQKNEAAHLAVLEGREPSMEEIAADVKAEMMREWGEMHSAMSDEEMEALFGEERMSKLRKRDVEKLKATQATAVPRASNGTFVARSAVAPKPPVRTGAFFENLRAKRGG